MREQTNKEIAEDLAGGWWWGSLLSLDAKDFEEVQKEYKDLTGKELMTQEKYVESHKIDTKEESFYTGDEGLKELQEAHRRHLLYGDFGLSKFSFTDFVPAPYDRAKAALEILELFKDVLTEEEYEELKKEYT